MYEGFVERARAVTRTLEDRRTTFVVVSTLEEAPVREAEFFIRALDEREFHLGALVLNKVLPAYFLDDSAAAVADVLCHKADPIAEEIANGELGSPAHVARVLREVGESFLNYRVVATREAEQRKELGRVPEIVAAAPFFETDIYDLAGLLRLGESIWR
jgi:anion-transporting  ArsA/GET3 family ATPase